MPIRTPITLEVLRYANVITTYSKETLGVLQELALDKKTLLIPNFVDVRSFNRPTSSSSGSGTRVVLVSRLSQDKDPITAIRAFARAQKEVPEATLQIIGYGPLHEYASSLIQNLNLEGAVTMLGKKTDVRKSLWNNDIFVATRGSYIATLEAWAAGLAVIAPEFGIMKELISNNENGLLVPPGNINRLATAMISLMRNKDLRLAIAAKGAHTLEEHDIRKVALSIAGIYKSLL
jgi:glycosyltransferase involved in cell wall biosynthesis